ncbi:hydroxyisourate hydrolase [Dongia soli]|uniref:5-hydroxyisourate hydrolase n=1 Tax=Dongia soli TaxID=600628 RepID=A0ABU5E7T7_9PROT|nr:hydroxyisourate hydrolase [Dongia soli]MDY0881613.1 hydroxyisourate hydrolase [Dongia soli]
MSRLTTHVLNVATGRPAEGLSIELWVLRETFDLIKRVTTNADGRVDEALLDGDAFKMGVYELRFFAGEYLRKAGTALADPAFLDVIPVRFGIADPEQHYHVPLLLSPYGYSTYRGS